MRAASSFLRFSKTLNWYEHLPYGWCQRFKSGGAEESSSIIGVMNLWVPYNLLHPCNKEFNTEGPNHILMFLF